MTNINDLRINNILEYSGDYFKVKSISNSIVGADRNKGIVEFKPSELKPIPISEEILLKVGFRKSSSLTPLWTGPDPMLIWRTEYESDLLDNYFEFRFGITHSYQAKRQVRLDYLHQLQNLYFALTGSELNTSGL